MANQALKTVSDSNLLPALQNFFPDSPIAEAHSLWRSFDSPSGPPVPLPKSDEVLWGDRLPPESFLGLLPDHTTEVVQNGSSATLQSVVNLELFMLVSSSLSVFCKAANAFLVVGVHDTISEMAVPFHSTLPLGISIFNKTDTVFNAW